MADQKLTQLTEDTSPTLDDLIYLVTDPAGTPASRKSTLANLLKVVNAPSGFLINGQIVPSVASNDLTVAIKGMDGNDPSASNPVYVRIGNTVRTITAALSVTKADGTNWFNSGSAELATKEIDYFVYLGYNATDGVVIGFSRIPYAKEYDDFSATTTDELYCAISTITNAASGDDYEVVGRFAATLSAGAGYTWTVPTFTNKNLIQRPIYETRVLTFNFSVASWTAGTAPSGTIFDFIESYQIRGKTCRVEIAQAYAVNGSTVTGCVTGAFPISTVQYQTLNYGRIISSGGGGYAATDDNSIAQFRTVNTLTITCSSLSQNGVLIVGEYDIA